MFKYLFCSIIFFVSAGAVAQSVQDTLLVVPGKENLYFYHVVTKGETLYGVARKYHLEPQRIADVNQLTLKTPLKLFQLLKIPLNQNNFVQSENASAAQLTPLYHKVIKGETLYRVSQMHDKVDPGLLKKWNRLKGNEVKNGTYLVVGWLKADNESVASPSAQNPVSGEPDAPAAEKPKQDEAIATDETLADNAVSGTEQAPPEQTISNVAKDNSGGGNFLREVIAAESRNRGAGNSMASIPVSYEPVAAQRTAPKQTTSPVSDNTSDNTTTSVQPVSIKTETVVSRPKSDPAPKEEKTVAEVAPKENKEPAKKEKVAEENPFSEMLNKVTHKPETSVSKPVMADHAPASGSSDVTKTTDAIQTGPVVGDQAASPVSISAIPSSPKADSLQLVTSVRSEFEQQFDNQTGNGTRIESKKGAAGWFPSNVKSGSGRYYALCNELPRGRIVKVINPISGKYILAKVLDAIPKQKENYNLIIKLSDAAMEDLGTSQSRFWCEIRYAKGE